MAELVEAVARTLRSTELLGPQGAVEAARAALTAIEAEGPTPEMITAGIEAWGEWLDSEEWRREVLVAEMFRRMMAVATTRPLKLPSPEETEPIVGAVLRVVDAIPPSPGTVSYRWRRNEATYRED